MNKPWQPYALHILDTIERIRHIQTRGDLAQDQVLYDAALRNLQTLSEATQQLPETLKSEHPDVPWRSISGFRNILVRVTLRQGAQYPSEFAFAPLVGFDNLLSRRTAVLRHQQTQPSAHFAGLWDWTSGLHPLHHGDRVYQRIGPFGNA